MKKSEFIRKVSAITFALKASWDKDEARSEIFKVFGQKSGEQSLIWTAVSKISGYRHTSDPQDWLGQLSAIEEAWEFYEEAQKVKSGPSQGLEAAEVR